jgi:hypothetical protein
MIIEEYDTGVLIVLNEAETDTMFDPFDPLDDKMPSYLHHRRHRYIKEETYDWLETSIGSNQKHWRVVRSNGKSAYLWMSSRAEAVLFKLTWGES